MNEFKRTIECEYLGQRYRFRTHEDGELTEETLRLVDRLIRKNSAKAPSASPNQILMLSLLELASEYLKSKKRVQIYQEELAETVSELEERLKDAT